MGVDRRIAFLLLVGLTGCSMAPDYRPPATPVPRDFKELEGWTAATPMDQAPRGQWWEAFGDPVLNDLEARAEQASPNGARVSRSMSTVCFTIRTFIGIFEHGRCRDTSKRCPSKRTA